jgi:hypothetical protein
MTPIPLLDWVCCHRRPWCLPVSDRVGLTRLVVEGLVEIFTASDRQSELSLLDTLPFYAIEYMSLDDMFDCVNRAISSSAASPESQGRASFTPFRPGRHRICI